MVRSAMVIALTTDHFHAYPEVPPPVADAVLVTPVLSFYFSADIAAKEEEGLDFVEGDITFFAADGSSLVPKFSREPYVNQQKNTYFPGIYSLQPSAGKTLADVIAERIAGAQFSEDIRIVALYPQDDEDAQARGWKNAADMEAAVEDALKALPGNVRKKIIF